MITSLALTFAVNSAQLPKNCANAAAFTGTICTPASAGKHPTIILLGGSEGGDRMSYAAPQFAQRGFVAASVAYFGLPGLPQTLENVPVETVGKAIEDLSKRDDVDPNRMAIMGLSKGGELALLAASTYPQIHAVIADVPSPFAWQGIAQGPSAPASSWSLAGKPLPFVHYGTVMGAVFGAAFMDHQPLDLRKGYEGAMQENKAQIPVAMFHLENIHGPVMMLAAGDDQIWDSVAQSQIAMQYLHDHHHPYNDIFVQYPDAGHVFLFSSAQRPMTQAPMGSLTLVLGGTAQANVQAAEKAWPQMYAFLSEALK